MKKSKLIALILTGVLAVSVLAGCEGSKTANSQGSTNTGTGTAANSTTGGANTVTAGTSFEEVVVVDNSKYTMKITGIKEDPQRAYSLVAVYENKLSAPKEGASGKDKNRLDFLVQEAYINDYACSVLAGAYGVEAGTSFENTIDFNKFSFEEKNLTDVTKVELVLVINNTDDWNQVYEDSLHVTFYPQGESKYQGQSYTAQGTDQILADNDDIKVVSLGTYMPQDNVYGIRLYVENKTANEVKVGFDHEKVNGTAVDSHTAVNILPGRHDYVILKWSQEDMDAAKVSGFDASKVENVEFEMHVYNADLTQGVVDYLKETFVVTP